MPTQERRFYLGLLTKDKQKAVDQAEETREKSSTKGSKGSRTTKVSGNALKNKLKSGEIPTK